MVDVSVFLKENRSLVYIYLIKIILSKPESLNERVRVSLYIFLFLNKIQFIS